MKSYKREEERTVKEVNVFSLFSGIGAFEKALERKGIGYNLVNYYEPKVIVPEATKKGYAEAVDGDSINLEQPNSKTRRERVGRGVAQTLNTAPRQAVVEPSLRIRKLTPKECFRLMGFDDVDIDVLIDNGISNTQLYKQAGNSIVVNVLEAIFDNLVDVFDA